MGFSFRIEKEKNLLRVDLSGTFTMDDIMNGLATATENPDLQPPFKILSDHIQLKEFISPEQVKLMVNHFSRHADRFEGARWAVVTSAQASYGMMRMMGTLLEPIPMELRLFSSDQEAMSWLGFPVDPSG